MFKKILFIVLCLLGLSFLFVTYKNISNDLPMSYFDEEWWISDSYFFQFYIEGNYSSEIWNNSESSDQPNLTRFLFGAWIYPKYLKAKENDSNLDYTRYLINNGFYFNMNLDKYIKYKTSLGDRFLTLGYGDSGSGDSLIQKYGPNIKSNIDLIAYTRQLNVFLTALTMLLLFIFFKNLNGYFFSLLFIFFYASNSILLDSTLIAHSEASFILFFNIALIYLFKYFSRGHSFRNLIMFSLFLGVCFSTKLNGLMLFLPFLLIALGAPEYFVKGAIVRFLVPLSVCFIVFIVLNPYTYSSPLANTVKMFAQREVTVQYQISAFPDVSLPTLTSRIVFIAKSLYSNRYLFIPTVLNGAYHNFIIFALFVSGFYVEIKKIKEGSLFSKNMMIIFCSMLAATVIYVQIAWTRYVIHLVLFYIYYVVVGLNFYLLKTSRKLFINRLS